MSNIFLESLAYLIPFIGLIVFFYFFISIIVRFGRTSNKRRQLMHRAERLKQKLELMHKDL